MILKKEKVTMQKVCRNCCKIFCKQRDTVTECNKQITFVRQMIENIDKEAKSKNERNRI